MATLGTLIGIALTLCVFSFLYKDNPFYTFAEHLFVGLAAGYSLIVTIEDGFIGTIWQLLELSINQGKTTEMMIILVAICTGLLFFTQFIPDVSWLVRIPFAITIGYGAGLAIPATVEQDIFKHIYSTIRFNETQSSLKDNITDLLNKGESTADLQLQFKNNGLVLTPKAEIETLKASRKWEIRDHLQLTINDSQVNQDKLNQKEVPDGLKSAFAKAGFELSPTTKVKIWKHDHRWQIMDNRTFDLRRFNGKLVLNEQWVYTVKRELKPKETQVEVLNVYVDFFHRGGWQAFNMCLIFVGVICTLTYFFFSVEHRGLVGGISKVGVIFIMVGFGAAFGNTVMGRVSLLIGRVTFLIKAIPSLFGG